MRRQLFASAVSVALLLGAASPALAKPGKGQAKGHDKPAKTKPAKDPKPPKTKDGRVNGGGITVSGAEFSVQAREGRPSKGHFNYTAANGLKIRCKGVTFSRIVQVPPIAAVEVTDTTCFEGSGKRATKVELNASFYDNGASGDRAIIRVTRAGTDIVNEDGTIREGNIHIR